MTEYLGLLAVVGVFAVLAWLLQRAIRNDGADHGGGLDSYRDISGQM